MSGFGKESISFFLMKDFNVLIYVHNFSNEIYLKDSKSFITLGEKKIICPEIGYGKYWLVGRFNNKNKVFKTINKIVNKLPYLEN